MNQLGKGLIFTGVQIADGGIDLTYVEERDQGPKAALMKSIAIDTSELEVECEQLYEILTEILDYGLLSIRNPKKTLSPRERIMSGSAKDQEAPVADTSEL